jgi:hypothetical protein
MSNSDSESQDDGQLGPAGDEFSPWPFRVDVSDETLDRIRSRVETYRWDALPEPMDAADWRYGPPLSFMRELCRYWCNGYDWRSQERVINAVPHFMATIDGLDLHFVHERGSGPAPRPILIAHGWPYSFHSYIHLIDRLAHPERHGGQIEDAFSVVIL